MTAILTFVIICVLYMYLHYNAPEVNWGSSTQAQVSHFHTTISEMESENEFIHKHNSIFHRDVYSFAGICHGIEISSGSDKHTG